MKRIYPSTDSVTDLESAHEALACLPGQNMLPGCVLLRRRGRFFPWANELAAVLVLRNEHLQDEIKLRLVQIEKTRIEWITRFLVADHFADLPQLCQDPVICR